MKAQADIVSAVIIVVIALGLMATAYFWGFPLIQKRQDTVLTDRAHSYFNQENVNSLPNVIESIANVGGEKTFFVDVKGIWLLNENEDYIQFTFISKVSKIAVDTPYPISLTSGAQCTPRPFPPNGTLGLERASVVCAQANRIGNEINITYKIWFRPLYENPYLAGGKGYKIDLKKNPAGLESSTEKSIRISFSDTKQNETLITKEIKILLI